MKFKVTYDKSHDTFRMEFLVVPSILLALVIRHEFTFLEVLWTFSIYLEAVAILPQLFMVSKTGEAETITSHYLFALGSYRGLYLLNWIWRYYFEGFIDWIAIIAGIVQTVLYCDFFYLYVTRGKFYKHLISYILIPCFCFSSARTQIKIARLKLWIDFVLCKWLYGIKMFSLYRNFYFCSSTCQTVSIRECF